MIVVGDDNKAAYRAITLGGTVDGLRVVTAGLKAGERIVVNGLQRVRPGALRAARSVADMGARLRSPLPAATPRASRSADVHVCRLRPGGRHESLQILYRPPDLRGRACRS